MSKKTKKISNGEIGYIKPRSIVKEMKDSYIDYAMSVIVSRALPDVRDGLKPVQRRILYAMYKMGLTSGAKFRKSATVVGTVLGRYHPHGDTAVYDALVRMAQDFSMRYPLVHGQGNFGSLDSDPPAAQRYTEAKLEKIAEEILADIEKDTVDFVDNYDGTHKEPTVLPSKFPQLLLNGSLGIAVGMATKIPPHNLSEICNATIYLIDHPKATTKDLFEYIEGPDFPTGGIIYNRKKIIEAYSQGKGPMVTRASAKIVSTPKQGSQIVISEIPYLVKKSSLIEKIAQLVKDGKIIGIKDIRDESDKEGLRIAIDVKQGAYPERILNRLYKFTELQTTFHLNMVALIDGIEPRILSLPDVLNYFIIHRKHVVERRTKYDLEKAEQRAHILEGLLKALKNIDAVIKTIKLSKNREEARKNLIKKFKLTTIQAEAILDMRLASLARLERQKIEQELKEKKKEIKRLSAILKSKTKIKNIIKNELEEMKEKYGDKRRTKIVTRKISEIKEKDIVPEEEAAITLTQGGYIKRSDPTVFKIQKRGGTGIMGMETQEKDIVKHFLSASTHDSLLFFTNSGRVFKIPVYEIPKMGRVAKGRGIRNFLQLSPSETVLAIFPLEKTAENLKPRSVSNSKNRGTKKAAKAKCTLNEVNYLVMATKSGVIKKTALNQFQKVRKTGLIAIKLNKGDLLQKVCKSSGKNDIILITQKGQAIRFSEKNIRAMSRTAAGVKGINLKKHDLVIGMDVVRTKEQITGKTEKHYLLVVSEKGYGKRTLLKKFRLQTRGGKGIKASKVNKKTGNLVASRVLVGNENDLILISQKGQIIRTKINSVSITDRNTQGVRLIKLKPNDKVASITCI